MSLPKIIAVVGTTASGKTDLAIELAKEFNGEIISVDSRQIYREMDIGTAKEAGEVRIQSHHPVARRGHRVVALNSGLPDDSPTSLAEVLNNPYEIQDIPHYMINVVKPDQVLTLAHFQKLAFGIIEDILLRGKVPILAGGTGLYTSAIIENWQVPEVKPDLELREELEKLSDDELVERLREVDSEIEGGVDLHNRRRVIRAIEVHTLPPSPSLHREGGEKAPPKYDALLVGYTWPREVLYDRINKRVDRMVEEGLVEEVRQVGEKYGYDTVAMTGHAYQQIGWHLQGKMSLEEALEETKKATRHYAKRQMTWWRKHGPVEWVKDFKEAREIVENFLT